MNLSNIEILAPAGDIESFKTAIYNGANAIYLGLGSFNARLKANSINTENLRECVKFAHLFGVKVYLTVNTLIKDEEINDFINLIKIAVDCKIDAYIVQDLGVAEILKNNFSGLILHASTQMGIHNLKGAKVAEKLGFVRIVVSRETKLEDIIEIKNNTNLEIEYFVQGALCVAFSGNCYLSSILSNKSGNRGECLQLCRLPYTAMCGDKKVDEGYLLSTSDLCLIKNLSKLINAGVVSFKIEGRLRRPGYVAQTVNSYRRAIDNINKMEIENEISKISKVFNRGEFNSGYYLDFGVPNSIINKTYNNHVGIKIGKVNNVRPFKDLFKIEILSNQTINKDDGLKFFRNNKEVGSLGVGNVEVKNNCFIIYSKQKVSIGDEVYRTLDYTLEQSVLSNVKKIEVDVEVIANIGKPFEIILKVFRDGRYIQISNSSNELCEEPKNKVVSIEDIINQIDKTNDTNFNFINIKVSTNGIFLSKSIINKTRREALDKLENTLINKFEINNNGKFVANFENSNIDNEVIQNNIYVISNTNQLKSFELNKKDIIAISPEIFSINDIQNTFEKIKKLGFENLALNLPIVCNNKDMKLIDNIISNINFNYLIVNNIWGLDYTSTHKVIAGIGLNVFSNNLKRVLKNMGVYSCVKSIESISSDVKSCYIYSYGYFPLMTLNHCPYKTIYNNECKECSFKNNLSYIDPKGRKFKIRRYKISQCYFELLNNNLIEKNNNNKSRYLDIRS